MGKYHSFVMRIWMDDRGQLKGKIEHVGSHETLSFKDLSRMLRFVRSHVAPPAEPPTAPDSPPPGVDPSP